MHKFLIVGKNGYIAQNLLACIKDKDVICTSSSNLDETSIHLDLKTPSEFDFSKVDETTLVALLAADSSPDSCKNDYDNAYKLNVIGTSVFIQEVLAMGAKVLFFSSDTVYGETTSAVDETTDLNPLGSYAEMKAEVENKFKGEHNFKVFRLSYVFSRRDKFMVYILSCIKNGQTSEVFEPLDRAVVHIDDVIQAILAIENKWDSFVPSVVNLAGPELISRATIARCINELSLGPLDYRIVQPGCEFYDARPRVIDMKSRYLSQLLDREPVNIRNALQIEFKKLKQGS